MTLLHGAHAAQERGGGCFTVPMMQGAWGGGLLLHGAHAAQELGSCFTVPTLHRTAQRYLVALTLARVQSDKGSGEPEEPVWEWKWVVLSVPQFYCSVHPNKEQPAGSVQPSNCLPHSVSKN